MYQNPVYLPQFSNREDFLLTVGIYDDDTFSPINLHGFSTATGQAFTGTSWTVTDGSISTSSATSITIPALPSTGQLSALALTVGNGLAIKPGDPIKIADTNPLNTMSGYVTSYVSSTGALVCQIGMTYQFEIRRNPPNWAPGQGYAAWYDFGVSDQIPILTASLGNGEITVIDLGMIQILIPEAAFKTIGSGTTYDSSTGTFSVGMTMTDSVNTRQLFIASLPAIYGGVTN